jgi:hypothetical protein
VPKSLSLAGLLLFALTPHLRAEPLSPSNKGTPPTPALQRLIEQLGDSDFRKRDEAVRLLEAEGMPALPALKKALGHPDAEVRRRVHDLIPQLETAAYLAPRRVTLKMNNRPLRAIFDELTRQAGYKIEFWANNTGQTYSFTFEDVTFWEAFDRICQDASLVLQANYGDERLILQQQPGHVPHIQRSGAFRFVPTGFQLYRHLNFGLVGGELPPAQRSETLTLSFQVFSEPRIPLLGMGEVRLNAAYDNQKNSMLLPANPVPDHLNPRWGMRTHYASRYGNGNRSHWMQSQFNLARPSEKASLAKSIRGTIPLTVLVEQKPVVVTDKVLAAKGKKVIVGTTTFFFEDVSALANKQYQLKLTVTEDNKENPNDYTWMSTLYNRIELQDEKGNKYQVYGSSWGNGGPTNVQMTLTYGQQPGTTVGPPARFVFHEWTTMEHLVSFEFKDLPLP